MTYWIPAVFVMMIYIGAGCMVADLIELKASKTKAQAVGRIIGSVLWPFTLVHVVFEALEDLTGGLRAWWKGLE